MSGKIVLTLLLLILFFIPNASAEATFANELNISDSSIDFIITEKYTGDDAESFRIGLDTDEDGNVSSSEVARFVREFEILRKEQYGSYIMIDDGDPGISINDFDLEVSGAEGSVGTSRIDVKANIVYDISTSLSAGKHSIWILGHPAIENIEITLPENVRLSGVDGLDDLETSIEDERILLEGRSGIRSFQVDGRQTFEYAVLIETYRSEFIADLSIFSSLF